MPVPVQADGQDSVNLHFVGDDQNSAHILTHALSRRTKYPAAGQRDADSFRSVQGQLERAPGGSQISLAIA